MKPISHPNPSGDREIARGLHSFIAGRAEVFVLSEFRARNFFLSPVGILRWLACLWRAYLLARKERPDLFFTYHTYYKAPDGIGFLLARWFGKPYVVFEGIYGRASARRGLYWIGYWLNRAALRQADKIFCDKSQDYHFMREWFPGKTFYVPPSLDLSRFFRGPGNEIPVIATVAMLRPGRKTEGVKFLVNVLGRLAGEGLDFYWRHAGGGSGLEEVRALAGERLGDRADLMGEIQTIPQFLAGADIFAFPGIDEAFGLAFAEAQAAGLPVVAFRGDGSADAVLDGQTGFLTPGLDEEAYAQALRRLIAEPALRKQMGDRAKEHSSRFDREKNYSQLLK
jgi:glycosyltransferase involved in cell wall biosynthesis